MSKNAGKILVIRKPDKTIHKVNPNNEAALRALSNKQPAGKRWSFEFMSKEEADKLPFIDTDYVTAGEAQVQAKDLQKQNAAQANRIAELEALLAGSKGTGTKAPVVNLDDKKDTGTGDGKEGGDGPVDHSLKTVAQLKEILTERSIEFEKSAAKATLVDLLEKADAAGTEDLLK